jgi:hypothetical protein
LGCFFGSAFEAFCELRLFGMGAGSAKAFSMIAWIFPASCGLNGERKSYKLSTS